MARGGRQRGSGSTGRFEDEGSLCHAACGLGREAPGRRSTARRKGQAVPARSANELGAKSNFSPTWMPPSRAVRK